MGSAAIEVGPTSVPQMVMLVVQLLAHQERVRQSIGERREVDVGSQAVTGPLGVGGVGRVAAVPPLGDCPLIVAIAPTPQPAALPRAALRERPVRAWANAPS